MDVLKAIALGARGVFVGRPLFWGLANGGQSGVSTMLEIMRTEFDRAMAYAGCRNVSEIHRGPGIPQLGVQDKGCRRIQNAKA